jgi:hypothetical protein
LAFTEAALRALSLRAEGARVRLGRGLVSGAGAFDCARARGLVGVEATVGAGAAGWV